MVTILLCLVVLGGAAAAILLARSAVRQPASDLASSHLRRRALRAGADRATAFLIPSGPPTTAHVRYRHETAPAAPAPVAPGTDVVAPAAAAAPAEVDVRDEAPAPSPERPPAPVPEPPRPRFEPLADLDERDDVGTGRMLEPALLGFASPPPVAGTARSLVLAPARLLGARLLTARAAGPVVDPSPDLTADDTAVLEHGDVTAPATEEVEDAEPVRERPPRRPPPGGSVPHPVRRVLRRLRGATLLVALLVGLGLVLAVALVAALALAAIGVRAAVGG